MTEIIEATEPTETKGRRKFYHVEGMAGFEGLALAVIIQAVTDARLNPRDRVQCRQRRSEQHVAKRTARAFLRNAYGNLDMFMDGAGLNRQWVLEKCREGGIAL